MSAAILQIEHLVKHFRSHWSFRRREALKDISLEVYRGESFGFLGHNGAGKTTTIKCIVGLLKKTSGRIYFNGELMEDPSLHSRIGYLPELPYFYDHLTVEETLDFFGSLHGLPRQKRKDRISTVLERVGLTERRHSEARALSKGLQQRLGFAQAILNEPELLLLDEPFSGLDPVGRREMRELILELKAEGTTIFLSSHILSDVEEICDRVSIMAKGTLRSVFYLKDIPSMFGELFELSVVEDPVSKRVLASIEDSASSHKVRAASQGPVHVLQFRTSESANRALQELASAGCHILTFQSIGLRLEDIFMQITNESTAPATNDASPSAEMAGGQPA